MRALLCASLIALSTSLPAFAGNLVDLSVVDRDTGTTLPTYMKNGKLYIAGKPGHRYAVRMSNRSGGRILAVLSVDGVNAVSGETAGPSQNGYVLDAWETTTINGWRKSLDEVAQFNFTALPDSYAAQTGRPDNVGVIGVAVFTERVPKRRERQAIADAAAPPPAPASAPQASRSAQGMGESKASPAEAESSASDAMAKRAEAPRLGTGHGEREWSRVGTTTFERASSRPAEQVAIWYDSRPNLIARGIIPRQPIARHVEPDPFPNRFVPDPPRRW